MAKRIKKEPSPERVAAFKEAGVTVLSVNPVGADAVRQIETLRDIVDSI